MRRFVIRGAFAVSVGLASVMAGCASRDIHRDAVLDNQPLDHTYVYMTRDYVLEAGKEPVEFGSPAVNKDTLFVASETRGLEAMERSTFRRKWSFVPRNGVSSQLVLDNNILYFGANDGWFYAVDAEFGKVLWKYEIKAPVYSRATVTSNRVYVTAADDVVYCLDRMNGKWVWHYRRGVNAATTVHGNATPVLDGTFAYVGFSDGYFVALNAADGNLKWEQKIHNGAKFTDVDAAAVIEADHIYIPSYDGGLYVLEKTKGKVLWHVDIGGSKRVLIEDKQLYVASSDGHVYSLNKDSGKIVWKFELDSGTPTSLVQHENYLAFGSSQHYFYAIRKGDGSLAFRYNTGIRSGFVATPIQFEQNIYAFSNYGNMHVFSWVAPGKAQRSTASRAVKTKK